MFDFRMLVEEFLHAGVFNFPFILAIDFVADQNKWELFRLLWSSLVEELGDPGFNILEGLARDRSTLLLVMS